MLFVLDSLCSGLGWETTLSVKDTYDSITLLGRLFLKLAIIIIIELGL